jgi:glyoxylase I family protein
MSKPTPSSLVRGVHHVSVLVDDLDQALAFYSGLLGCPRLPRPPLETEGAWLHAGNAQVHLLLRRKAGPQPRPSEPDVDFVNHIAFEVEDLEQARDRLASAGHDVRSGDPDLPQVFVLDPSGNLLELNAPVPRRG